MWEKIIVSKIKPFLSAGATAPQLALSLVLGLYLGVFPVMGVMTFVMMVLALRWRLNLPLMLAVSYMVLPLQLTLIYPFILVGAWMFGVSDSVLTIEQVRHTVSAGFLEMIRNFGEIQLFALGGWFLVAALSAPLLYAVLIPLLRAVLRTRSAALPVTEA